MVEKNAGLYWADWNVNANDAWIEIILHTLCCIIIIIVLIFGTYLVYYGKRKNSGNKLNKYLLSSLIMSFIYIFVTYFINVVSITVFGWRPKYGCLYRNIVVIPLTLQRLIAYSFYILRLQVTFKETVFEISLKCIYIFIISAIISMILGMIFYLIPVYLENINGYHFKCTGKLRGISLGIAVIIDTLWSIIFSVIYIKKLIQITKLCGMDDDSTRYIVKKLAVLAITSVATTHLLFVIFLITKKYTYQFVSIDQIVNNVCIVLSFKILDKWYNYNLSIKTSQFGSPSQNSNG